MKKWIACIAVVVAFLFATLPFLMAAEPETRPADESDAASAAPKLTDEQIAQVKQWIKDLGSDQFATREAAEESLKKTGPGALPLVQEQVSSSDAEVAERAARIVDALEEQMPAGAGKVKVTIKLDKEKYKVGETMQVSIAITSKDKKARAIPVLNGYMYPWQSAEGFELKGADGKAIEPKTGGGPVAMPMIARMPLILQPDATINQTVAMVLLKDEPQGRGAIGIIQKRAQLQAGAAPVERAAAKADEAADGEKPEAKPVAFLRDASGIRYFPVPAAGKYTLRLRCVFKADDGQGGEDGAAIRQLGGVIQFQAGNGQVVVLQGGQVAAGGATDAKPLKGTLESNEVAFEVLP